MELTEALRTTGAAREFSQGPVADGVLARVLDNARFAPSGGNRQAWRVIVVKDPAARRAVRDVYLKGWYEYLAMGAAGLVPWAPVTDRVAEAQAVTHASEFAEAAAAGPGGMAEHLDEIPAMLLVAADLGALAAVDRDLDRYTMVGGASVYPFCWSVLLAAREEGLGGVMTTMAVKGERELKDIFALPDDFAVACVVALGYPLHQPHRLKRKKVADFTTVDRFDGPRFA